MLDSNGLGKAALAGTQQRDTLRRWAFLSASQHGQKRQIDVQRLARVCCCCCRLESAVLNMTVRMSTEDTS